MSVYVPPPTLERFMLDPSVFKSVIGPFGSGKSVACSMLIGYNAMQMPKSEIDGVRRSRVLIVRNTFKELNDTSRKTFCEWFPPEIFGRFYETRMQYNLSWIAPDGSLVELEVLFRAMDSEEATRSLLSLELTGVWPNESREIKPVVIQRLTGRIGRYPSRRHYPSAKEDPRLKYIIMDSNPPMRGSWLYCMHEKMDPEMAHIPKTNAWSCYHQPSGLSDEAENLGALGADYYQNMIDGGMSEDEIRTNVKGEYALEARGTPVHAGFRRHYHVSRYPFVPFRGEGFPIVVGVDTALSPAMVFLQTSPGGRQVRVLDEVFAFDMGMDRFIRDKLRPKIAERFLNCQLVFFIDPAGAARNDTNEMSVLLTLQEAGFEAYRARVPGRGGNAIQPRLRAVDELLAGQVDGGKPMLQIDPRCTQLIEGLESRYRFHEERHGDIDKLSEDGRLFSHVCDALQYGALHVQSARSTERGAWVVETARQPRVQPPAQAWF